MNPRIVPQPLSHLATSEKSSVEIQRRPNNDDSNAQRGQDQKVCTTDTIMERVSDLDTTNIFPHLDFNVRRWIECENEIIIKTQSNKIIMEIGSLIFQFLSFRPVGFLEGNIGAVKCKKGINIEERCGKKFH